MKFRDEDYFIEKGAAEFKLFVWVIQSIILLLISIYLVRNKNTSVKITTPGRAR